MAVRVPERVPRRRGAAGTPGVDLDVRHEALGADEARTFLAPADAATAGFDAAGVAGVEIGRVVAADLARWAGHGDVVSHDRIEC